MKQIKTIFVRTIWTIAGLYLSIAVLLKTPAIQKWISSACCEILEQQLGTKVEIGTIEIGLFNRIIIDNVSIYDRHDKPMVTSSRLAAKVDILSFMHDRISISSAQFFGLNAVLYKKDEKSNPNFQFILDALTSKDSTKTTPLNLDIQSLVIRNGAIKYDRYDKPRTPGKFNVNHINVKDISSHIKLYAITEDSISLYLKKLSFTEKAGLDIRNLRFIVDADYSGTEVTDFNLQLPRTNLNIAKASASYTAKDGKIDRNSLRFDIDTKHSEITPGDLNCFVNGLDSFHDKLFFHTKLSGTGNSIAINTLRLYSQKGEANIEGNGYLRNYGSDIEWKARLKKFHVNNQSIQFLARNLNEKNVSVPEIVTRIGDIRFVGELSGQAERLACKGNLQSGIGKAQLDIVANKDIFNGEISTDGIDMRRLLDNDKFGILSADIKANGKINNKEKPLPLEYITAKGHIRQVDYNSYRYSNITLDGTYRAGSLKGMLALKDPNGILDVKGSLDFAKGIAAKLTAEVRNFNPTALKLTDKTHNKSFAFDLKADINGTSPESLNGLVDIANFKMSDNSGINTINSITLNAGNEDGEHFINLQSDFGTAEIKGRFKFNTIGQSLANIIETRIASLPGLPKSSPTGNRFDINAHIQSLGWLKDFFNIPLEINSPLTLTGSVDDRISAINMIADAPNFTFRDNTFNNTHARITTYNDTIRATINGEKVDNKGQKMLVSTDFKAADNKLTTNVLWNISGSKPLFGTLNAVTDFYKTVQNKTAIHTLIGKSELTIDKTKLDILPSEITYIDKTLSINNFKVSNNSQNLTVNGAITRNENDSLTINMQNIDVGYVLDLVNFHSVTFAGQATGQASVKSLFTNPKANANLKVENFTFEHGRMGTLYANVDYNSTEKQINIDAVADDSEANAKTVINGYVSPERNYIDLGIKAEGTRLEFIESFCGSFMDNVTARGNGFCRVFGDLKFVNLEGKMVADGTLDIKPLHTTYRLKNDTITMIPDEIMFHNDSIFDSFGHHGIVNGALHHKHLTRLTFDLNVDADNLLAYDAHDYNGNSFYGTVFATGNCAIKGRSGETIMDINVTPNKGSFIEYNAAEQGSIAETEFIRWRDVTPQPQQSVDSDSIEASAESENVSAQTQKKQNTPVIFPEISSDVKLNFIINATPDFTLRILMDQQTGDYIALNGSGGLRANYFNKGSFDIFGNYFIDDGVYKLTIQNIIKKDFRFRQGSSIAFGGDPFGAAINLKGIYTLNAVSLSDLQIGRSFKSNNIRVNCLMDITGTAGDPKVTFDLDLPTLSTDAQQMIRSVINSEEDMNQQVLYLLAVGRFYTQGNNNAEMEDPNAQSRTSLAMQSLLSGTISQQINTVLSNVVKSNNWNFGANISTGDEGWNNAEYEGLLSGRLLNNRLLINGQFGYRDKVNTADGSNFIGDFDIRYLLFPSGNLAIKVYNQTNDRYFTRNSLNTQGIGLIMKKDFTRLSDIFGRKKKNKTTHKKSNNGK